jgi:RNA polymerase sigma-70 factor (ECF subfamily)
MNTLELDPISLASQASHSHYEQREKLTDEELLKILCYSHQEWALEALYERYKRYTYSLAYRILSNSFMAEDVVQEVFLTLWQKAAFYHEQQGSVKSWLQAIVRNRAIDKTRSWHSRNTECAFSQPLNEMLSCDTEPELWEHAWQDEQARYVRKALLQLPPEQRLVIEMSYFAGYTHIEIAKSLQLTLGTVKGRMRLGLQKMRRILQAYSVDIDS